jgi:REP element-mobilizing transposase RayT
MNKYNPNIHHRRSIRLKGYDYSQAGLYFITICCQDRFCRFGDVVEGEMVLNEYGEIAHNEWMKLTERFPNFKMDVFQIMPNHMHGIIFLTDPPFGTTARVDPTGDVKNMNTEKNGHTVVGAGFTPAPTVCPPPTVPDIVGAYKSLVANGCLKIYKSKNETMGKLWQRNYYEHIIRNEQSYQTISEYIINNPAKWANDKFYRK